MSVKIINLPEIGQVQLQKKRASRSLRLAFTQSGEVRISLPVYVSYQAAIDFVLSKKDWINLHRPGLMRLFKDGDRVGKAHQIVFKAVSAGQSVAATVKNNRISINVPDNLTADDPEVQLKARAAGGRALKLEAEHLLPRRLAQLAARNGFEYKSISIRLLKSRWGSCSSHHHISLSYYLMQLPWPLIDYVLLHELTHTRHLNHSKAFWNELENLVSDTKQKRIQLKTYRPILTAAKL